MKKITISLIIVSLFFVSSFAMNKKNNEIEKEAIKKVVQEFIRGFLNLYEVSSLKKCMHPHYLRLGIKNNELSKSTISHYIEYAKKMKIKEPEGREGKAKVKFLEVDTIGNIGYASFEVYLGSKLHGTDYFLLLKFEDGWKIIRAIDQHDTTEVGEKTKMENEKEKQAMKDIIQEACIDGFINFPDEGKMKKGIHPEFTLLRIRTNKQLSTTNFSQWTESAKRRKVEQPGGRKVKVTANYLSVNVTGTIGYAKVEFYDGPELHGTDFVLLLKFEDGWKMVCGIAYTHT